MIQKYGKEVDFRGLGRNLEFIKAAASQAAEISLQAVSKGVNLIDICPICKSGEKVSLIEINGCQWVRCTSCGQLYVRNIPHDISKIYIEGNEAQKQAYISEELFNKRREMISRPKAGFIDSVVMIYQEEKGLWVDLGCGVGELLCEASALGWEPLGYDADPNEVDFAANHGVNVIQAYINEGLDEQVISNLSKATVVSIINVIEHVIDPISWIKQIVSHMRTGSYLVIETPREPSLISLCNLAGLPYKHMVTAGHYHIFTEESMKIIQQQCLMELVAKWCFGNGYVDLIYTLLMLSEHKIDSALIDIVLENSNSIQCKIDEVGLSEVMILVYKVM